MKKPLAIALMASVLTSMALPAMAYMPKVLKVGFAPWDNPQDMAKTAGPMVQILAKATGMRVEPYLASDYSGVIEAMRMGKLDIAFYPPAAYVLAEKKAHARVILKSMFDGRSTYYSAIFTRKDSGIKSLQDLKGRTFAFVDPTSTSGAVYPKVLLMNAGINPQRDFKQMIFAGGHDAVVMAVLRGKVDAGAVFANDPKGKRAAWTLALKDPKEREQIQILAVSKPIPADNLAVKDDLDPKLVNVIKKAYLDLSATPEGRAKIKEIFKVDGFTTAVPSDYEPVREAFSKVGLTIK